MWRTSSCTVEYQTEEFISTGPTPLSKDSICAYCKGHSKTTALLTMKDDITCAMKHCKVTLAILANFSKAFDTVAYKTVLNILHHLGFSKSFLRWVIGYLTGHKQFVQIDDWASKLVDIVFGVP